MSVSEGDCCDIVRELQGIMQKHNVSLVIMLTVICHSLYFPAKGLYDISDKILLLLDWTTLKDAGLVSKAWREVVCVAFKTISRKGNPNWTVGLYSLCNMLSFKYIGFHLKQAAEQGHWLEIKSHLLHDFCVPLEDPIYCQRLANSIKLATEVKFNAENGNLLNIIILSFILILQKLSNKEYFWSQPKIGIDYLPYDNTQLNPHFPKGRIEMNENFIVAWEPKKKKLNYWSRRSLSPLKMNEVNNRSIFYHSAIISSSFCLFK